MARTCTLDPDLIKTHGSVGCVLVEEQIREKESHCSKAASTKRHVLDTISGYSAHVWEARERACAEVIHLLILPQLLHTHVHVKCEPPVQVLKTLYRK